MRSIIRVRISLFVLCQTKKQRLFAVFFLHFFFVLTAKVKHSARNDWRNDQPNRSQHNQHIDCDCPAVAIAHANPRHKVEIENAHKPPVETANDCQNIGNIVCNDHTKPP